MATRDTSLLGGDFPTMMMEEFDRRANAYVEESFTGVDRGVMEAQGLSEDQMKLLFRQNFSRFIAAHFVVLPSTNEQKTVQNT